MKRSELDALLENASPAVKAAGTKALAASLAPPKRSVTDVLCVHGKPVFSDCEECEKPGPRRKKPGIRVPKKAVMSAAERQYGEMLRNEFSPDNFECRNNAVKFSLASGCLYSPDWTVWLQDRLYLVCEVKGQVARNHSDSRSVLAFKTAAAEWRHLIFRYAKKGKDGEWTVTEINNPSPAAR